MFMCFGNQWEVINLDLTWKQSLLIVKIQPQCSNFILPGYGANPGSFCISFIFYGATAPLKINIIITHADWLTDWMNEEPGNTKGGLLFDWFGISCMTTDNFCFYLRNRLIQTSQTGGQRYNDTSPFSIPWRNA